MGAAPALSPWEMVAQKDGWLGHRWWLCRDAGFALWGSAVPCPHGVSPGLAVRKQSWEQRFSVLTLVSLCDRLMALP